MFTNYLKITFRLIRRNKIFTLINISGLAIGMACCIVILLFVQFELSFDKFHKNADQICRMVPDRKMPTRTSQTTKTRSWMNPCKYFVFPGRRRFGFHYNFFNHRFPGDKNSQDESSEEFAI